MPPIVNALYVFVVCFLVCCGVDALFSRSWSCRLPSSCRVVAYKTNITIAVGYAALRYYFL